MHSEQIVRASPNYLISISHKTKLYSYWISIQFNQGYRSLYTKNSASSRVEKYLLTKYFFAFLLYSSLLFGKWVKWFIQPIKIVRTHKSRRGKTMKRRTTTNDNNKPKWTYIRAKIFPFFHKNIFADFFNCLLTHTYAKYTLMKIRFDIFTNFEKFKFNEWLLFSLTTRKYRGEDNNGNSTKMPFINYLLILRAKDLTLSKYCNAVRRWFTFTR